MGLLHPGEGPDDLDELRSSSRFKADLNRLAAAINNKVLELFEWSRTSEGEPAVDVPIVLKPEAVQVGSSAMLFMLSWRRKVLHRFNLVTAGSI